VTTPVVDPGNDDPAARPFVAPCRSLDPTAPLRWLRLGWADITAAPALSLGHGAVVAVLSLVISAIALRAGSYWALLVLLSGFVFVAPVLALGLYAISRQLAAGVEPTLAGCLAQQRRSLGNAMVFALALLVVFLVWARAGSMVHVFFPADEDRDHLQLLTFLAVGSAVGSIFALVSFAVSALSLPMLCDRDVDAVTAVVSSVNAVLRNKGPMAVWIALIVALVTLGFATAMLGLVVVIPLLGHATFHAYRETLDATGWPLNPAQAPATG
jgi:uncharacterized membrane protein